VSTARLNFPAKLAPILSAPRGSYRYRGAYGGRGSGKSFNFAKMAAIWGYAEQLRILCTRELQVSIRESFHAELERAIVSEPWLSAHYRVGESFITGANGTDFIFKGLRHNMASIKSMAGVDLCIVEEAEDVPEASWRDLIPTIRAPKSEIWVLWNPRSQGSPVDVRFRRQCDPDMAIINVNHGDNPWFPAVLEAERQRDRRNCDPSVYAHIWDGDYLSISDAQILRGKFECAEFTPQPYWDGPYYGADWGFSIDPTALVKLWIHDNVLYVEHEAFQVGCEIVDLPRLFDQVPGARQHTIRADSARPETISHMRRQGFRMVGADKGKGSVEDGIAHLRGYDRIVVHPNCPHVLNECRLYSYKVDRLSGDILPVVVDAHNHGIDAIRYALEPIMQRGHGRLSIQTPATPALSGW